MEKLVYLLPVLGCAAMMGGMMWMMMRGNQAGARQQPDPTTQEDIAVLRAEIASLRAQQTEQTGDADRITRT